MPNNDPYALQRFHQAQHSVYPQALRELQAGRKRTHWMWFVFPQLRGLGSSAQAHTYGLSGVAEARAYLADPVLGARLREATQAVMAHAGVGARRVLGEGDALKLRSCLTLFALVEAGPGLFSRALDHLFAGRVDAQTLALLQAQGPLADA